MGRLGKSRKFILSLDDNSVTIVAVLKNNRYIGFVVNFNGVLKIIKFSIDCGTLPKYSRKCKAVLSVKDDKLQELFINKICKVCDVSTYIIWRKDILLAHKTDIVRKEFVFENLEELDNESSVYYSSFNIYLYLFMVKRCQGKVSRFYIYIKAKILFFLLLFEHLVKQSDQSLLPKTNLYYPYNQKFS